MFRILFCLSFLVVSFFRCFSQSASVSGGGDVFIPGIGGLSATIGQFDYQYVSNQKDASLSAGVQQPFVEPNTETGNSVFKNQSFSIKIAPNPTPDYCLVTVDAVDVLSLNFTICDMSGRVLKEKVLDSNSRVSFLDFPKGVYLLLVSAGSNDNVYFKIIKE